MKLTKKDFIYVVIQLLLFVIYIFRVTSIDFNTAKSLQYTGLIISITGACMILISFISLNKNLTLFPSPIEYATLITTGIYKFIRHPIYTGIIFITAGYGLYSENTLRLFVFIILMILFISKAKYEERMLLKKFPEYAACKIKTAKFLPGIY